MNEVLRQEKKRLITLEQYYDFSNYVSKILKTDEHCEGDGYLVTSLYFDTLCDRDFGEKAAGVLNRRKIRLRNYGPDSEFALLEMKQKTGELQKKRSLKMSAEKAKRLISGDYSVLLSYEEPFAAECFYLMQQYCYRPKSVVTYYRKAFVAKENKIRVTFDHHIVGTEANFDIFSKELQQYPLLDTNLVVLEVKYNGFLLSYIKDMLKKCDELETSVSKYCLSRKISTKYVL